MKKSLITLSLVFTFIFTFSLPSYTQNNNENHGKSFYTLDEVKKMCGFPIPDAAEMKKLLAKQDSMYKDYIAKIKNSSSKLSKTETIPNWRGMMSDVEVQDSNNSCWVHAATGIVEGQLHILNGSKIGNGIDLNESEIDNIWRSGGLTSDAERYIKTLKLGSEVGSYPNL
jgi:hypothetical protein